MVRERPLNFFGLFPKAFCRYGPTLPFRIRFVLVDERPQHQRTSFKRPRRAPDAPQGTPRIVVCVDLNRNPTGQSGPYCKSTQHIGALLTGRSASSQEGEQAGSQAGTGSSRQIYTDFFERGKGGHRLVPLPRTFFVISCKLVLDLFAATPFRKKPVLPRGKLSFYY